MSVVSKGVVFPFATGLMLACATFASEPAVPSPHVAAAQMMGIGLESLQSPEEIDRWIRQRGVGLLIAYRASLTDEAAAENRIRRLRERASALDRAPLIAVDQEGGSVVRFEAGALPGAMALAASGDPSLARRAATHAGCTLRKIGVNVVFAPVLDLARPGSPLGTRAYASDPELVTRFGTDSIEGFASAGVLSVAKHFPGQGGAVGDPHESAARIDLDMHTLRTADLRPFVGAIQGGVAGMMTAHATYAAWDDRMPATFSRALLSDLLRKELAFDGLVVTDVLEMPGAGGAASPGELAVRAIEAGADLVLVVAPRLREPVHQAIVKAIESGRLAPPRVAASVRRIAAAKRKAALPAPSCNPEPALRLAIARAAITSVGDSERATVPEAIYTGVNGAIARAHRGRHFLLPISISPDRTETVGASVAAAIARKDRPWVAGIQNEAQARVIESAARIAGRQPDVLIVLGSPWDVGSLRPKRTIFAFGFSEESQSAALSVAMNERCATGRMPVSVAGIAQAGEWDEGCEARSRLSSKGR